MQSATSIGIKRILIVDDQKAMADFWQTKFLQMGFEVKKASNGEEAISAMKKERFDMMLLDLYMPKMNGFQVLEAKSETLNDDTPTYVITSSIRDEDVSKVRELGAARTFLKYQTSPKEVVSAVQEELSH